MAFLEIKRHDYKKSNPRRNRISPDVRRRVLARFNGLCGYCGHPHEKLQCDHINPYASTADNSEENLMPSCPYCNNFKNTFSVEQFRNEISMQVIRGKKQSVNFRMALRYGLIKETGACIKFYFERGES